MGRSWRSPGCGEPVEILRDRWGIAHIYARNEHDLFLAQGYNAARDRLFQLELWRRQATGTLAEIQGPRALAGDVGARLLRFRGDMAGELDHYHPRGAAIVGAFVGGINAYIEQTEREPARLPVEFRVLGIKPGRWTPEVVVSRHNGLYRNVDPGGRVRPARPPPGRRPGPGSCSTCTPANPSSSPTRRSTCRSSPTAHGDLPGLARPGPVPARGRRARASAPRRRAGPGAGRRRCDGRRPGRRPDRSRRPGEQQLGRSPAPGRPRGAPILANDPHRSLLLPSLRYWVHLVAPGWDVIGAGEPALPGVSVGHNEHGAWGFTIFPIDQEDLYVYETDPADPSRYRYRGGWEAMRTIRETIAVKGAAPVAVDLKFTRHGPVVAEDRAHHRAYAIRAAWLEPGGAPYLASLRIDQAASWAEFREACRSFHVPSENMVWADRDGHIGWQAVGLAPRRKGWNGLLPVPGDGRYEWDGFLPILDLPHVADPPRGWFASANQDNLPPGYPFAVSYQWTDPFRFARIEEVLGSSRRFDDGGLDAAPARRAVAAGAVAGADAPGPEAGPGRHGRRRSSGCSPGTS